MKDRIKMIRKNAGMTQEQFSKAIGISRNFLANVETSNRNLGKHVITEMCRKFGINENWVYTGEGDMYADTKTQDDIFEWVGSAMATDPFKMEFLRILSQLRPEAWAAIETLVHSLLDQQRSADGDE